MSACSLEPFFNQMTDKFPLSGIIGVVANDSDEIDMAHSKALGCVELRADLLLDSGISESQLLQLVEHVKSLGLGCLYTLRHPGHGGKYPGSEAQRVALSEQAVAAGADIVDLEWDTDAGREVAAAQKLPLILSYHNFNGMLSTDELQRVTQQMESMRPAAIKIVPTAATTADAVTMLQWVSRRQTVPGQSEPVDKPVIRIGFAMGGCAAVSRILTTAQGGAVTYAAFGEVVAPGQIDIDELRTLYRVGQLNDESDVIAVCGKQSDANKINLQVSESNRQLGAAGENRVAIGFPGETLTSLQPLAGQLRIHECLEI